MTDLILKLLKKETVTDSDIHSALYEICDNVHASCGYECPVYALMTQQERKACDCQYHKDGAGMAKFIMERSNPSAPPANKKMDSYFAVFNCHINSADKKAKKEFLKKYGEHGWDTVMAPIMDEGIMSIFKQPPTAMTQFFVDRVTFHVNVGRE